MKSSDRLRSPARRGLLPSIAVAEYIQVTLRNRDRPLWPKRAEIYVEFIIS